MVEPQLAEHTMMEQQPHALPMVSHVHPMKERNRMCKLWYNHNHMHPQYGRTTSQGQAVVEPMHTEVF